MFCDTEKKKEENDEKKDHWDFQKLNMIYLSRHLEFEETSNLFSPTTTKVNINKKISSLFLPFYFLNLFQNQKCYTCNLITSYGGAGKGDSK